MGRAARLLGDEHEAATLLGVQRVAVEDDRLTGAQALVGHLADQRQRLRRAWVLVRGRGDHPADLLDRQDGDRALVEQALGERRLADPAGPASTITEEGA